MAPRPDTQYADDAGHWSKLAEQSYPAVLMLVLDADEEDEEPEDDAEAEADTDDDADEGADEADGGTDDDRSPTHRQSHEGGRIIMHGLPMTSMMRTRKSRSS